MAQRIAAAPAHDRRPTSPTASASSSASASAKPPMLGLARPGAFLVVGIRIVISLMFALLPDRTMRMMFGTPVKSRASKAAVVQYVIRDFALGYGLYRALKRGRDEKAWMAAGTVADAVDFAAIVATAGRKETGQKLLVAQMTVVVISDCVITALVERSRPKHLEG